MSSLGTHPASQTPRHPERSEGPYAKRSSRQPLPPSSQAPVRDDARPSPALGVPQPQSPIEHDHDHLPPYERPTRGTVPAHLPPMHIAPPIGEGKDLWGTNNRDSSSTKSSRSRKRHGASSASAGVC